MNDRSLEFLNRLLAIAGPSGQEAAAAQLWHDEAASFADHAQLDLYTSAQAVLEGGPLRVLLAGHIDEIGIVVTYIDEQGYLACSAVGTWDAQVLVGQRVRLLGRAGDVIGLVGKKPVHLLNEQERGRGSSIDELWIDIGAQNRAEAQERLRVGDLGVIDAPGCEFPNGRIVARSIDNRIGAFVILEALRLLARDRPPVTVAAVATSQEEITLIGATTSAFNFQPHVALAVDVTFTSDTPGSDCRQLGDVKLGGGPVLMRGGINHPLVFDLLVEAAEEAQIPYAVQVTPRYTYTDADAIHGSRGGVATATVLIPSRYMHSPNAMVALADVEQTIRLIEAFVRRLHAETGRFPHLR